jgi:hypothetical protein
VKIRKPKYFLINKVAKLVSGKIWLYDGSFMKFIMLTYGHATVVGDDLSRFTGAATTGTERNTNKGKSKFAVCTLVAD